MRNAVSTCNTCSWNTRHILKQSTHRKIYFDNVALKQPDITKPNSHIMFILEQCERPANNDGFGHIIAKRSKAHQNTIEISFERNAYKSMRIHMRSGLTCAKTPERFDGVILVERQQSHITNRTSSCNSASKVGECS